MKKTLLLATLAVASFCCADPVQNATVDFLTPPDFDKIKIEGSIREKMNNFFNKRIFEKQAHDTIYREAIDAFKTREDDKFKAVGLWQGEFWGKLIISASRVQKYTGSEVLKKDIAKWTDELLATQEADGYIGTYKNKTFLKVFDLEAARKVMKWRCNWCWNLWCRKYTLWGLLEAYEVVGDKKILAAAVRATNQYIDMLKSEKVKVCDTGTFFGMPTMSILKPMLILYRKTGDKKYLDFATEMVEMWDRNGNPTPNFLQNAFSGVPIYEWYPNPEKWAKAYEMMSCLEGLLEYHRATGDERCLKAVQNIHENIWKNERNPMGSVGYNDQFHHAAAKLNALSEPCDAIHWMRLNSELFKITGDPMYADIFEETFYNAFVGGVFRDGSYGARAVRIQGRHFIAEKQAGFLHNHCCVDNMPRGFMNAAKMFAMTDTKGELFVNLYSDAVVNPQGFKVEIDGKNYFTNGEVSVKIKSDKKTRVHFRIPAWSKKSTVDGIDARCGFYVADIEGEKTFSLKFDLNPHIVNFTNKEIFGDEVWERRRWSNTNLDSPQIRTTPFATMRIGPLLLARSKNIGNTEAEMFESESINLKNAKVKLVPVADNRAMCVWDAEVKYDGGSYKTRVCDYASAADLRSEDPKHFSACF